VSADVTLRSWLREADAERIERAGTDFHAALARALRIWTPVQQRLFEPKGAPPEDNAAFLHDPLTLTCVYDASFCGFETLEIEPAIEHGVFRTFVRASASDASFPMRCATSVNATEFREHFVERVLSLR
jgi:inosine-uridine nucleoside N-ribohydrolase